MTQSSNPDWLIAFANRAASTIRESDLLAPIGCHTFYNPDDDEWEVTLFSSQTEVVGGECDGLQTFSVFTVDLLAVFDCFDAVLESSWQNLPVDRTDELGCHVAVTGVVDGKRVWLRVLSVPPPRFGAGRIIDVNTRKLEDLW